MYAGREDSHFHLEAKIWLEGALNGSQSVCVFDPTLASFLRIVTNRRIFKVPTPLPIALAFVRTIRLAPASRVVTSGPNHWVIFEQLCGEINAGGDDIPDAYLAALAIENNCDLMSTDGGFARFARLRWRKPF